MTKHHYKDCGLPNVFIYGEGFERRADFGAGLQIPALQVLHTIIALSLVIRDFRLSGPELKFLRSEFGFSKASWSHQFAITREQISIWESGGEVVPSNLELRVRAFIFGKIWERSEDYKIHRVDIKDEIEKAQPIIDHLPLKILRNDADREIKISHDGGGRYRLILE